MSTVAAIWASPNSNADIPIQKTIFMSPMYGREHSWRCAGLHQLMEYLPGLSLLLHKSNKVQLLLIAHVEESDRFDDFIE